jgi:hypothetical protein
LLLSSHMYRLNVFRSTVNHLFPRSIPEVMASTVPAAANANADITAPSIPEVQENIVRAPSPILPNASSSTSSLSFLLNGDPETQTGVSSPPEFRSPTPDIRTIVGMYFVGIFFVFCI